MMFLKRTLRNAESLSQTLRSIRKSRGYSIDSVADSLGIDSGYIHALETGHYELLPGITYIRQYLRKYCDLLCIKHDEVLQIFDDEYRLFEKKKRFDEASYAEKRRPIKLFFTPQYFKYGGVIVSIVFIFAYFATEASSIMKPPELLVEYPADNAVLDHELIEVSGHVESEALVFMNGQEVFLNENGRFEEPMNLSEGVNILRITAQKKHGAKKEIFLRVVVKEP